MLLAPSPSQQKALDVLLGQQQDRTSPNYHKWLTPQQFADRFGLSQNDFSKVTAWLTSQGFHTLATGSGRSRVVFSGTAAQVQSAFGTEIHRYEINGKKQFANSTPVLLPAQLGGLVYSIMGLHSFLPHPASQRRIPRTRLDYHPDYSDATIGNLLAPDDVATVYDINPLYSASTPIDGSGQKLAVVGQTDVYLADLTDFRSGFGLNQITGCATGTSGLITSCNSTYFQYVLVGADPGTVYAGCGDLGESDLDIEWSGAVARNSQIVFVNSPIVYNNDTSCTYVSGGGVNAALGEVIDPSGATAPLATVVSMSYGVCEQGAGGGMETLLQQGNTEGVTILNSSGDDGAAGCDYSPPNNAFNPPFSPAVGGLMVSYPASSPEVTGVGGTEITLANEESATYWGTNGTDFGSALSYIPEIPWNDDEAFADFCESNSTNSFCTSGGSPAVSGWVPITSAATAQKDIWISAGGGGASNCITVTTGGICEAGFPKPSWQAVTVSGAASVRYVPDVSMMASPNFPGYIFCTPQEELSSSTSSTSSCVSGIQTAADQYESIVGGTSVSTPVFAGIVTLLNQYLGTNGLGNINPTLYQLAASSPSAFHKITSGDNNVYCQANEPAGQPTSVVCPAAGVFGFSASNSDNATGYNLVNGLGSVDANALFTAWAASLTDFTLAATPGTATVVAGNTVTTTITLSPVNGFSSAVTYTCSSGVTCTFSPNSPTTATTVTATILVPADSATGAVNVTITGAAGSVSSTATVALTVTATTETFKIAPSTGSYSVVAGSAASVPIAVSSSTGFTSTSAGNTTTVLPLTYTCSGLPTEANCNFSPAPTSSLTAITLSVTTAASTAQLGRPLYRSGRIFYALLLPGFGIVFVAGSRKASGRGVRMLGLIFVVVLGASTLWLSSCGGNSTSGTNSNPGTPAGSYTVTVNATTGGANPITNFLKFTLVVSQ
jgi:subtilase family serine protease